MNKNALWIGACAFALMIGTAAATAYFARSSLEAEEQPTAYEQGLHDGMKKKASIQRKHVRPNAVQQAAYTPPAQAQVHCSSDGNVLGMLAGGAAGGLAGSTVGKGSGKTAATVGGALGGAYLGGKYLPFENQHCQ